MTTTNTEDESQKETETTPNTEPVNTPPEIETPVPENVEPPPNTEYQKMTKLFVGGLPFTSQDKALYDYFHQFGEIVEAVVIRNHYDGASKGYGFVTLKDPKAAELALKDPNPYIDGRRCNVNLAFKGSRRRDRPYVDQNGNPYIPPGVFPNPYMGFQPMFNMDPRYPPPIAFCPIYPDFNMQGAHWRYRYDTPPTFYPQTDQYGNVYPQNVGPIFPMGVGIAASTPYGAFVYPNYMNANRPEQPKSAESIPHGEPSPQEQINEDMKNLSLDKNDNLPEVQEKEENNDDETEVRNVEPDHDSEYEMELREKKLVEDQKYKNKTGHKPYDLNNEDDFPPMEGKKSSKKSQKSKRAKKSNKKGNGDIC